MADKEPRTEAEGVSLTIRQQATHIGADGRPKPNRREIERTGKRALLRFLFTLSEGRVSVRSLCRLRIFLALRNLI